MSQTTKMAPRRRRRSHQGESGSVMMLALLMTLVILGVGITAMFLSSSGVKVSGNISRRHEALSAAESGVERAVMLLRSTDDWDPLLDGSLCSASHDEPEDGTLPADNTKKGAVLCDPATGKALEGVGVYEASSSVIAASPELANVRYTVYIRNDNPEVELTKDWFNDEDKRVTVRAEGTARDNLSFFAIEVTVSVPPPANQNPCPYGQAGGCGGTNQNAMKGDML